MTSAGRGLAAGPEHPPHPPQVALLTDYAVSSLKPERGTLPQDASVEAEERALPDSQEPKARGIWLSPQSIVIMYSADGALHRLPALYHIPL